MPFQSRLKNQINTTTVAVTVNFNCLPRRMRTFEPVARNIDDEALRSSYLRCWARAFYTVNQKGQRAKSKGQRAKIALFSALCSLPRYYESCARDTRKGGPLNEGSHKRFTRPGRTSVNWIVNQ